MPKYVDKVPDIDPDLTPQLETYEQQLAALVDQARQGEITRAEFRREANELVAVFILLAFLLAGGSRSVPGAQAELDALADDIFTGAYSPGSEQAGAGGSGSDGGDGGAGAGAQTAAEANRKLGNRLTLWLFGLASAWSIGQSYSANQEKRFKWQLGATEKHCSDCLRLDGQVHTAAEWRRSGWRPRIRSLDCGGWRCDCRRNETDEQVSGNF